MTGAANNFFCEEPKIDIGICAKALDSDNQFDSVQILGSLGKNLRVDQINIFVRTAISCLVASHIRTATKIISSLPRHKF